MKKFKILAIFLCLVVFFGGSLFAATEYTVNYDSNGGTKVASQTVEEGEKAIKPEKDPTKTGYYFSGWKLNGEYYNFNDKVTENITLVASWRSKGPVEPGNSGTIGQVTDLADNVWATILPIVQIISLICFAFAGLRYMFASPDKKADLKRGLLYLALGSVFAFAATTVISIVFEIGNAFIQ